MTSFTEWSGSPRAYAAALAVAVLMLLGLSWAVRSETPKDASSVIDQGDFRFKARPVGADSALSGCVVCHTVESGGTARVAPNLAGIVGAPKARAAWFAYSPALRRAGGVWTETALDEYLKAPAKAYPGTSKTLVGIADAKQRADIIAALKASR